MELPLTLLMHQDAYCKDTMKPLGRRSAGADFLEGYFRYGSNDRHHIVVFEQNDAEWFHKKSLSHNKNSITECTGLNQWGSAASSTGAILLPGPGLDEWAWKRMPWEETSFSLIGVVHTLCSKSVQWGLGQFCTSPVHPWDALVCTSKASKACVNGYFDRQEEWLKKRVGATKFERPMLPIIPLGIHPEKWRPKPNKREAKELSRQKLGLKHEDLVILIAGRIDILTKANHGPLIRVLNELNETKFDNLKLLVYGCFASEEMQTLWQRGISELAPNLPIMMIGGENTEVEADVRWAADLFVSLSDNPQETFGITPLEAMASELPCIVSDWNGYKDTITKDVGCRIETSIFKGIGQDEMKGLLCGSIGYDEAVGKVAQGVAIDLNDLRKTLIALLGNPELLRKLGENGRKRAESIYSWEVIIKQWKDLARELKLERDIATKWKTKENTKEPPWMPDISVSFKSFPSTIHDTQTILKCNSGITKEYILQEVQNSFNNWDKELVKELKEEVSKGFNHLSPRAKGWLLKNNFAIATTSNLK